MKRTLQDFRKLIRYEAISVLRARWLGLYGVFFAAFTFALLRFGNDPARAAASLSSLVLLVVPMISILYASITWYAAEPFTALLLTQPMSRSAVWLARWASLSLALGGTYLAGTLAALAFEGALYSGTLLLLAVGVLLCLSFVAIGMAVSVCFADRMKGIGAAFALWMYFALVHDALVFAAIHAFQDYPIETPALVLMAINPIDLARVGLLLGLDLSAMLGYTGRILMKFLSGGAGPAITLGGLVVWTTFPFWLGLRRFEKRDL
ncbi:MAG: ABC transporter permease [Oligoflexia bacterium]|nr:ABC transporter permease [Oligoflexia bacterium]